MFRRESGDDSIRGSVGKSDSALFTQRRASLGSVVYDEARFGFFGGPRRREAARRLGHRVFRRPGAHSLSARSAIPGRPRRPLAQALYRAKALGRNRVELWTHSPQSPSARQASGQAAA
jgi:hypothetical protein